MRKGGEGSSRQREQPMQRLGGEGEQRALGALWREIRWWGQVKIDSTFHAPSSIRNGFANDDGTVSGGGGGGWASDKALT